MKKLIYIFLSAVLAVSVIGCSDDPIYTGRKDFQCKVTLTRDTLFSGAGGALAIRIESNKQDLRVDEYSITYLPTGEKANGWVKFPIPYGGDNNQITINDDGYVEYWCEECDLKDLGGIYKIVLRLYDPGTRTYSDTFRLSFLGLDDDKQLSTGININCSYCSKTKDYFLSYDPDDPETSLVISVTKQTSSGTTLSGHVGIINDPIRDSRMKYITDQEKVDKDEIIEINKDQYSLFMYKDSESETSSVYKITPGNDFQPGWFEIYDKDDPSNRVRVNIQLRQQVCINLNATVGNKCVTRGTTLPYKLKTYGWYGVFTSPLMVSLKVYRNVEDGSIAKTISCNSGTWQRSTEEMPGSDKDYHLGAEKSDHFDNGFYIWKYIHNTPFMEDPSYNDNCCNDSFTVTFNIVTGWNGSKTGRFYMGNRSSGVAQHYNDLSDVTIPKGGRREFQVTFKACDVVEVPDLTDAMNYCCCLCVVANNYTTGSFKSTACAQKDGIAADGITGFGSEFGLQITNIKFDADKYSVRYFTEEYRGISAGDNNGPTLTDIRNTSKGNGKYGYSFNGGRSVWYEGMRPPVQDITRFNKR